MSRELTESARRKPISTEENKAVTTRSPRPRSSHTLGTVRANRPEENTDILWASVEKMAPGLAPTRHLRGLHIYDTLTMREPGPQQTPQKHSMALAALG
ncbi:hypothetical protein NDU88_001403 [Pleurodeles waltl]|uniref:Uncharacterized protein n=1 Tax=Pleurodeles waltl TaxID=8319 RepID=A0AAV7PCG1_PLEWA|nr:hypothetical protein NDU88_001403 [Pleurodeles waltl]